MSPISKLRVLDALLMFSRRTFVAWLGAVFGSFCGLSLVFQYNTYFFQLAGLADPFLASLIIKIVTLVFTFASFWTVELLGRRISLLSGGCTAAVMMLILGLLGATNTTKNGTAMVALFCIHDAAFSLFIAPLGEHHLVVNAHGRPLTFRLVLRC